jgi:CPA1 family monovalent cation:H+ antiporter
VALFCLALFGVVLLGTAVAGRTGLPLPVVLVAAGLGASLLPGAPVVDLPPDVVFLVFLPPLVYRASFLTDPQTLRANATPLALLSVGLVVVTAVGVALVVWALVPGLGFAEGLVLGAVVAPTDPVAASGVFARLGAPRAVVDLVEGESLINDATALVLYAVAVQAVVSGPPSVGSAVLQLVVSVAGGVLVGGAVGGVVLLLGRRVSDVGLQLLLTLFTPYASYLLADRFGASGVLAVVTAGVLVGSRHGGVFSSSARLQRNAFWSLLDLVLNAVLFVLLGLEVRSVLSDGPPVRLGELVLYGTAVVLTVVGLRVAWQVVVPPPVYRLRRLAGLAEARTSLPERLVIGWTGMRGAISLAAALALPLEAGGRPFPGRSLLLFLTVVVVLATLVVQGTSLPFVLRRAGLAEDAALAEQEREARLGLAETALGRLDELEGDGRLPPGGASALRQVWEQARDRLRASDEGMEAPEVDLTALRLDLARVQGEELERLKSQEQLSPEVVRELRQELDLQEVRLSRD